MKTRSPLDAALTVREQAVEDRAAALRAQVAKTQRAREVRDAAAAALRAEQERQLEVQRTEQSRAEHGLARAGDLVALAAWQSGAAERRRRLTSEQERAETQRATAAQAEHSARAALALADADVEAVELVRERRRAEADKAAEHRDEELGTEIWTNQALGRRRGKERTSR